MAAKKLEEEKQLFYQYLRQNGMKRTHQKEIILEVFLSNEGHLSVEDIYTLVKRRDRKIGIVTVFRTLKSLKDCGIAKEISLGDGLTRFEHCFRHPMHHHMVCSRCHRVIEFLSPELERVQNAIINQYGFELLKQRIQIEGVCRECRGEVPVRVGSKIDSDKIYARDALRLALLVNKLLLDFYGAGAGGNADPDGRAAFESLQQSEVIRMQKLRRELELLQGQEKGLEDAPQMLHIEAGNVQRMIPALQESSTLDAPRVRNIAGSLDSQFAAMFRDYAEKFGECYGKRIFQRLAAQRADATA